MDSMGALVVVWVITSMEPFGAPSGFDELRARKV